MFLLILYELVKQLLDFLGVQQSYFHNTKGKLFCQNFLFAFSAKVNNSSLNRSNFFKALMSETSF